MTIAAEDGAIEAGNRIDEMVEVDYEARRRAQILGNRQVMEATGLLAAAKDVRPVTQPFPSTQTKRYRSSILLGRAVRSVCVCTTRPTSDSCVFE